LAVRSKEGYLIAIDAESKQNVDNLNNERHEISGALQSINWNICIIFNSLGAAIKATLRR
jgi:hypothetical protein